MQRELVSLLNEQQRAQQPKKPVSEEGEEFGGLSSGHFQMPYDIVRDGVERTFRDHLQTLREQLQTATQQQQQQQQQAEEKEEEVVGEEGLDVATLQSKLSDYRDIIGRQELMLQNAETATSDSENKSLSESWVWRERERMEGDKTELEQLRDQLERDRHLLIEAAKKLDRERQTFEDDKVAFLKEQFLDSSVFNNTTELDSFYGRLSSTPAAATSSGSAQGTTSSGSTHISAQVNLRHDLSLCSDDGSPDVLNDSRPEIATDGAT
ncbi:hypothetical protein GBAR_LOCUS8220 [Geodia barretti]|uniref:Uncharacterized protein n=2 Tax=Geodia barretti TaxID=519541 RepID=A0AA35WA10_GEOBA|nr:hypothetical protein GBAR_LOCUS8220 [Geodia barretti]